MPKDTNITTIQKQLVFLGLLQLLLAMTAPFFSSVAAAPFVIAMLHGGIGPIQAVLCFSFAYIWPFANFTKIAKLITIFCIYIAFISNFIGTALSALFGYGRAEYIIKSQIDALPIIHNRWNLLTCFSFNISELIILGICGLLYGLLSKNKKEKSLFADSIFIAALILFILIILIQTFFPQFSNG